MSKFDFRIGRLSLKFYLRVASNMVGTIQQYHPTSKQIDASLFALSLNYEHIAQEGFKNIVFNDEQFYAQVNDIDQKVFSSLVILRTCNRIDLYGMGDVTKATDILLSSIQSNLPIDDKLKVLDQEEAVSHLFHVASGLKSKMMGDAEILGQFKKSFKDAKQAGRLCGFMERLANKAIECAKDIRTSTRLVSGSTSMAYAVIRLLRKANIKPDARILLLGMGDLGCLVAKNVSKFYPENSLTVTNRTEGKYKELQAKLQFDDIAYSTYREELQAYDVLISALGGNHDVISLDRINTPKTVVDLSVPPLFELADESLDHTLYSIDDAAVTVNETIKERADSIPAAEKIVGQHINEFITWAHFHQYSAELNAWSQAVRNSIKKCPFLSDLQDSEQKSLANKNIGKFAGFIKDQHSKNRHDLQPIKEYLEEEKELSCNSACKNFKNGSNLCTIHNQLD